MIHCNVMRQWSFPGDFGLVRAESQRKERLGRPWKEGVWFWELRAVPEA